MKIYQSILILTIIAFSFGNVCAQHLFSVSYGDLSQNNVTIIRTEVARTTSVSTMSMTKNRENKDVYSFSLSSVQNTKIVILNEETGNSVVITPVDGAPAQFELSPFFIEELRQATLGNADRYLVLETSADFSVRNISSVSAARREVFIPTYLYGPKENVKEALPIERQIIHIFKEKPRYIPAFPDDPENLRYVAELEEEMCYYVYMYQLPDGTLIIYDEHFNPVNPRAEKSGVITKKMMCCTNLDFYLSGNLTGQAQSATVYALNLWGAQLAGTVPVDMSVDTTYIPPSQPGTITLGHTFRPPHWFHSTTQTWYASALANQILGYSVSTQRDIRIELNSDISPRSWFFQTTGTPSTDERDWVTIVLHEMAHGLGFFHTINSNGTYAFTTPNIFDRQLYQGNTGNICLTDLNQTDRAALVISNNLFAGCPGSYLLTANGGNRVKMYAPTTWEPGSSVAHWNDNPGFTNFMQKSYQEKRHTFNTRKIGIMRDMGWEVPCPAVPAVVNLKGTINNPIIISTNTTVRSCTDINIEYLKVQNGAKLTLEAGGKVNLGVGFKVELGSKLEIK